MFVRVSLPILSKADSTRIRFCNICRACRQQMKAVDAVDTCAIGVRLASDLQIATAA